MTPLGSGVGGEQLFRRLMAGETGVATLTDPAITKLDLAPRVAAWVRRGTDEAAGQFDASRWVPRAVSSQISPFIQFAMASANMALQDARYSLKDGGLPPGRDPELAADRTGVCMGSGIGCVDESADAGMALAAKGKKGLSAYSIPKLLVNLAAGQISIQHGFRGPNHAVATACTTGAHSIGDAFNFIRANAADVMIAGSSEAAVTPLSMALFARIRALGHRPPLPDGSTPEQRAADDATTSRPFDAERSGFVMGEGAGVLVLEELEHARARGARIYAEVRGYGLSGDASHITAPHAEGRGSLLCMQSALRCAGLSPEHIDYVNAHATSTPLGDRVESLALQSLFGSVASGPDAVSVSSTKGALGHMLGAAGSVEALICCLAVARDTVPPSLNLHSLEDGMQGLNYVRGNKGVQRTVRAALSNSFGFGGTNATLIFAKYEEP